MKKASKKKPYTMAVYESLERIHSGKLSNMGLFELSIHSLMPSDVYNELKERIKLMKRSLENGTPGAALKIANNLLKSPQKNIKAYI